MPAYYVRADDFTLVASDVNLLRVSGHFTADIDFVGVIRHLLAPDLRTTRTCLCGLREVLQGHELSVNARSLVQVPRWSPWDFAAQHVAYELPEEASERVRQATMLAVRGWASCYGHIVLGVSGGLDSSIVGCCAAKAHGTLTCLTLATEESAGDERFYARELARALKVPLEERMLEVADVDLARSDASHLPRPVARAFAQSVDRVSLDVARAAEADAFFTGNGGDSVFCYQQSVLPVADRILVEGLGSGPWRTICEVAKMAETSVLRVAALGAHRAWIRPRRYPWRLNKMFLSKSAINFAAMTIDHPWLDGPKNALPGKAAHIAYLLRVQNHLEGFRRELNYPVISPLMSQPVVEACLRVSTWHWCLGSRNRSIARRAFADMLPRSIAERTTKGGPDGFVLRVFNQRRAEISTLLLDGVLAQRGLIDVDDVRAGLSVKGDQSRITQYRLLTLLDAEAWLRALC
ncbi:hypothetical protein AWL63_24255 (plasmid) [Sphingomonas panacis]|uniref:asparagine synthase (glutamine-hydrolyzing) n=2 Tax=Sphingomonas panacis TaxID=1560345 RepID=A0A1B3ZIM5_9SPHN|nr:hypothetical protein AWL63_24255 [Sphingomonas panacis]